MYQRNFYRLLPLLFIFLPVIFSSCDSHKQDREILLHAESLIHNHPDSTLQLLDSIYYPQDLGKDFYYHYILVQMQARYRCNENLSQDSIIFRIRNYYIKKNDNENMALSTFLIGCVLQDKEQAGSAMTAYLEAEEYAKNSKNFYLKGQIQANIGNLYYNQYLMDEAIERYHNTAQIYEEANDYRRVITAYDKIGNAYQIRNIDNDSAFIYYDKALKLAKVHNDSSELGFIYNNMGIAYLRKGDIDKSYQYFIDAIPFSNTNKEKAIIYSYLSTGFNIKGEMDSAMLYVNKAIALDPEKKDPFIQRNVSRTMYQIEETNNNFKRSLEYHKEYLHYLIQLLEVKNKQAILEAQKKFNFEQMKNENSRLQISKKNITILCLILSIAIALIIAFYFWRRSKHKQALLAAEQRAYQMKLLAESYDQDKKSMRNIILEHFNILKKTALIDGYMREDERKQSQKFVKKFNEAVYGQDSFDWDKTYDVLNHLYDNIVTKMRTKYPGLDESEFRICCLTYADLNNTEISIIMGFKVNTVQSKKYSVRKKLGINGYGNIVEFLKEDMKLKD